MTSFRIAEALARLKALRANLPDHDEVEPKYARELHEIIALLEADSGSDLGSFRVPASEIRPIIVGGNAITGHVDYSEEPYVERAYLLMKIDGVIGLFEILGSQERTRIGFYPPA